MTVRHHQPLQVTPGETDQGDLPDAGFPDALAVYPYDWDPDALDYIKHVTAAAAALGTVAQGAAGVDPWLVTATINTTGLATDTGQALQATAAKQDTLLTELQGKADLTETQPVSLATLPALATGGNVIGHVIVDSSGVVHVIIDSSATLTTNATLSAETTKVIGTVNLPAGTVTTLTPPAAITGFGLETTQILQATAAKQDTGNASLALAATAANQVTELASLALASTAALQTTGNASLVTLITQTAPLITAQAAVGTSVTGPMVQALVSDAPESYLDGTVRPMSLTTDGRLRVATAPAYDDLEMFRADDVCFGVPVMAQARSYMAMTNNPWGL